MRWRAKSTYLAATPLDNCNALAISLKDWPQASRKRSTSLILHDNRFTGHGEPKKLRHIGYHQITFRYPRKTTIYSRNLGKIVHANSGTDVHAQSRMTVHDAGMGVHAGLEYALHQPKKTRLLTVALI